MIRPKTFIIQEGILYNLGSYIFWSGQLVRRL